MLVFCPAADFIPFSCSSSDGWVHFKAYCYKFFDVEGTFVEADKKCRDESSHLSSIHSQGENDFLEALTRKGKIPDNHWDNHVWIGLFFNNNTKVWSWTDGSRFDYINWAEREPNLLEIEHFAAIMPDTSYVNYTLYNPDGGHWNNHNNRPLRGFLCKKHVYIKTPSNNNNFGIRHINKQ